MNGLYLESACIIFVPYFWHFETSMALMMIGLRPIITVVIAMVFGSAPLMIDVLWYQLILMAAFVDGINLVTVDFLKAAKISMDKCMVNRRVGPNNTVIVADPTEARKGILGVGICVYFAWAGQYYPMTRNSFIGFGIPIIYATYRILMYYKAALIRFACDINEGED